MSLLARTSPKDWYQTADVYFRSTVAIWSFYRSHDFQIWIKGLTVDYPVLNLALSYTPLRSHQPIGVNRGLDSGELSDSHYPRVRNEELALLWLREWHSNPLRRIFHSIELGRKSYMLLQRSDSQANVCTLSPFPLEQRIHPHGYHRQYKIGDNFVVVDDPKIPKTTILSKNFEGKMIHLFMNHFTYLL